MIFILSKIMINTGDWEQLIHLKQEGLNLMQHELEKWLVWINRDHSYLDCIGKNNSIDRFLFDAHFEENIPTLMPQLHL